MPFKLSDYLPKTKIKVKQVKLKTRKGKHIRSTTKVIFPDKSSITFMEKLPKSKAIEQALAIKKIKMPELV